MAWFAPVLGGSTFSTVPIQQSSQYPWRGILGPPTTTFVPQTDEGDLGHPWQAFLSDTLEDATLPLWNPYSFAGGTPHFANGSSAVLYPPRLLLALTLEPGPAHVLFSMLHIFLAGLLMYLLLKEFGAGFAGAMLAAVSWMFGTYTLSYLHFEVMSPMFAFLPLAFLLVRRAYRLGGYGRTAAAGLVLGVALLSGHILVLGLVWLAGIGYAAAHAAGSVIAARENRRAAWTSEASRLLLMIVISVGTAAVVLLPTFSVLGEAARDPYSYGEFTSGSLVPLRVFGYTFTPPPLPAVGRRLHEMAFVGSVTAGFALVGLLLRRRGAWLGRALLAAVFVVAIGGPGTWLAFHVLPGFDVLKPYSRLLPLWTFAVALLGGLGLDATLRWAGSKLGTEGRAKALRATVAGVAAALIGVTALQLGAYGRSVNPVFLDDATFFPKTPLIVALEEEVLPPGRWPGRILPLRVVDEQGRPDRRILHAAHSLVFGIDSAGGYDSVVLRRPAGLVRVLEGQEPATVAASGLVNAYLPTFLLDAARPELLTRLGITTLVASPGRTDPELLAEWQDLLKLEPVYDGPDGRVFRIPDAKAGPYLVYREEVVSDETEAFLRFVDPAFDFTKTLIVEQAEMTRAGLLPLDPAAGTGLVVEATRGVNSALITVATSVPSWLVVPDSWSKGWTATVNGEDAAVVRADYAKRAIRVPAGRAVVEMRYRPPGSRIGTVISTVTVGTSLWLWAGPALARLRRRRDQ